MRLLTYRTQHILQIFSKRELVNEVEKLIEKLQQEECDAGNNCQSTWKKITSIFMFETHRQPLE